jgi:hypothetical protein
LVDEDLARLSENIDPKCWKDLANALKFNFMAVEKWNESEETDKQKIHQVSFAFWARNWFGVFKLDYIYFIQTLIIPDNKNDFIFRCWFLGSTGETTKPPLAG